MSGRRLKPSRPTDGERRAPSSVSSEGKPSKLDHVPHAILDWATVYQDNFVPIKSRDMDGPLRLVAYTRLSQSNAHEGESHESQRERIEAWATGAGHEVVDGRRDTVSGENGVDDRPGFLEALRAVEDDLADGVVVSALDRLARRLTTQEALLATVWRRGGVVFEVGLGEVPQDDPHDPARTLIRQVMGAVSQYERAMIVKRMADGRRRSVKQGRLIGPAPAFGWIKDPDDPGRAVPDPETYPLVEAAVAKRNSGATLRAVGAYLEDETGRSWSATQVKRVCERYERYATT